MKTLERLLIVDGTNQFLRLLNKSVLLKSGVDVGGAVTFFFALRRAIQSVKPNKVYVVFDGENSTFYRRKLYPGYKPGIKTIKKYRHIEDQQEIDNEIQIQTTLLNMILSELPVKVVQLPYCESDDVIGYIVKNHRNLFVEQQNENTQPPAIYISSTDSDYRQLLGTNWGNHQTPIYLIDPIKGLIDYDWVKKKEHTIPENYALKKALIGDKSDGLPRFLSNKVFNDSLSTLFLSRTLTLEELIECEFKKIENVRVILKKRIHSCYKKCIDNVEQLKINQSLIQIPFQGLSPTVFSKMRHIVRDEEYPRTLNSLNLIKKISIVRFDDEHLNSKSNWLRYIEDFIPLTFATRA